MKKEDLIIGNDYINRVEGFDSAKHSLIYKGGDSWEMIRKETGESKLIENHPATTARVLADAKPSITLGVPRY